MSSKGHVGGSIPSGVGCHPVVGPGPQWLRLEEAPGLAHRGLAGVEAEAPALTPRALAMGSGSEAFNELLQNNE